jgi:hypothetical protein
MTNTQDCREGLLPCPFCKARAIHREQDKHYEIPHSDECFIQTKCIIDDWDDFEINRWNTRYNASPDVVERVAKVYFCYENRNSGYSVTLDELWNSYLHTDDKAEYMDLAKAVLSAAGVKYE